MNYLPLPEETKLEVFKELMSCCDPIFKDRTVFIILFLISLFDQDQNQNIRQIKENLFSMLVRYLEEKSNCDVFIEMQNINRCLKTLPRLLEIFTHMAKM